MTNRQLLTGSILFALAIDSTPEQVEAHIGFIRDTFGNINGYDNGVNPKDIAASIPIVAAIAGPSGTLPAPPSQTPSTSTAELDKNGVPWDERIHASTKGKNADGSWRTKRGVDADVLAKVTAELKGVIGVPASIPAPPSMPLPTPAAAPPALPVADTNPAYTALVTLLVSNTKSDTNPTGRLTDEWITSVLTHYQVPGGSLQNLAHNPALIETVGGYIKQALGIA